MLSIICNTICLQFSLYRAPLQSLGLFLLISSRISDFIDIFLNYINFNQYLPATCFLAMYGSYQCPVNFGKDSRLITRCVNGDFTTKHSNSFHKLRHYNLFFKPGFCSEYFISIKHRILATFNINKKNQSERLYAFKLFTLPYL